MYILVLEDSKLLVLGLKTIWSKWLAKELHRTENNLRRIEEVAFHV
jgi:hypothetical protein